jgi:hypothetical protein
MIAKCLTFAESLAPVFGVCGSSLRGGSGAQMNSRGVRGLPTRLRWHGAKLQGA